ncbi:hypothetical protein [Caulobacter sp. 602-1]|uniref:hypothetical protein n=1 Tax=unclassified Caulobacter TaxID=2648921 RepID=UPI000F6405C6|nr:hypothetical protein [Caulobacter sp. 602-1]RRN65047.1 hypothetical protein EIK80_05605 [Caulobacter sp. 602-1]
MRKLLQGVVAAAVVAAAFGASAGELNARGERSLDRTINGRVASQPVSCIDPRRAVSIEIMDRTAIVYRMPDNKLYVNRPILGVRNLDHEAIVSWNNVNTALCSQDFVHLYDRGGEGPFMLSGSVRLGQFVPYSPAQR